MLKSKVTLVQICLDEFTMSHGSIYNGFCTPNSLEIVQNHEKIMERWAKTMVENATNYGTRRHDGRHGA